MILVGEKAALMALVILLASPALVSAQEYFSVDTPEITERLRPLMIYQNPIGITSLREQVITAEIKCLEDISCQWASFAHAEGRDTKLDLPFVENESYTLFVEVIIPEDVNLTQHEFSVALSAPGQGIDIPYILRVEFDVNPIEQLIMLLDNACGGFRYDFPNPQFPWAITCSNLVAVFIIALLTILIVSKIRGKG
jgi:hypothetical protein